ncbi:unnamed protein product [Closterium sp. Yama58-4]|nr:unnamed protein product [Closterium sp. Yama58-4]
MHSPSHPNRAVSPPGPETAIRNPLRPSSLKASSENAFPGPIASPSGRPSDSVLADLSSAIALCNRIVHLSGPYPTSTSPHRHSASLPSSPSASPFRATGPPLPPIRNAALRIAAERVSKRTKQLLPILIQLQGPAAANLISDPRASFIIQRLVPPFSGALRVLEGGAHWTGGKLAEEAAQVRAEQEGAEEGKAEMEGEQYEGEPNSRTHSSTKASTPALATAHPGILPPRSPPTPLTTSDPPTPPHQPTHLPHSGASSPRSSTATGTSVFSAGPAAARQLVVSLSRGSALEKRTALRALLELSESSDAGKLHVTAAGVVPVIAVLLNHPDLGASFSSSSFGSSGGAAGIGGAGGPGSASRTGSGTTRSARTSSIGEELKLVSLRLLLSLVSLDENRAVVVKAGCVAILVSILRTGSPDLRAVAARVLWKVAVGGGGGGGGGGSGDNSRAAIAASEAIPSLVAILQSQTDAAVKQDAADAIAHLTANNEKNQVRAREGRVVVKGLGNVQSADVIAHLTAKRTR